MRSRQRTQRLSVAELNKYLTRVPTRQLESGEIHESQEAPMDTNDPFQQYLGPAAPVGLLRNPPPPPLMDRKTFVWGPFRKLKSLQSGAYGSAFLVQRKSTRQTLVLKVMKISSILSPRALKAMFTRETGVLRHLKTKQCSKYLVCIEDMALNESLGIAYFTMQYIPESYDMFDYTYKYPLTSGELLIVMRRMLEGLVKMHQSGIVHRDIKLENILITKALGIHYIDYGLGCITTEPAWKPCLVRECGTPDFLPPEVVENRLPPPHAGLRDWVKFRQAGDIWALGASLFGLVFQTGLVYTIQRAFGDGYADQRRIRSPDDFKKVFDTAWTIPPEGKKKYGLELYYHNQLRDIVHEILQPLLTNNWKTRLNAPTQLLRKWKSFEFQLIKNVGDAKKFRYELKQHQLQRLHTSVRNVREWPQMYPRPNVVRRRAGTSVPAKQKFTGEEKRAAHQLMEKMKESHPRGSWEMFVRPPFRVRFVSQHERMAGKVVESFYIQGTRFVKDRRVLNPLELKELLEAMKRDRWHKRY